MQLRPVDLAGLADGADLLALHHVVIAAAQAVTIIGIPFAWQHLKLALISLAPVGTEVVES